VSLNASTLDPTRPPPRTWPRPGFVVILLLAVLLVASFSVFLVDAVNAAIHNRVFIGADGQWANDQLQYLAWATDAGHHGLIANLYAFDLGGRVFLHPLWLLTGLLHVHIGVSYTLLMAVWKLVAVLALFAVVRAYAHSILGANGRAVAVAMLVALFMVSPAYLIANRLNLGGSGLINLETFSVYWITGYFPIALAVAAMIWFLLQVPALLDAAASPRSHRQRMLIASGAGVAASWLHPWQGMVVIVIVAGLVLWERPSWARHRRLLVPVTATAAPLVYYWLLPRIDSGWSQSQSTTAGNWGHYGLEAILITLIPVVILTLPGYAGRARSPGERMLRLWPIAIVVVYILAPSDKFHALGGYSVAAALLIVKGWPWTRARLQTWPTSRASALAVAGVCVAVGLAPVAVAKRVTSFDVGNQHDAEILRADARALDRIAVARGSGGVLTTGQLGAWVPAITDRATWTGHPTWTPAYYVRAQRANALFTGRLDRAPALERAFVRSTGARFVVEPCGSGAQLRPALAPAGFTVTSIGCATLYSR
jgi:hypothetical protein